MNVTWAQALKAAELRLEKAGIDTPGRDTRRLLAHALGIASSHLTFHLPEATEPEALAAFDAMIALRSEHRPLSHITGKRLFFDHEFQVSDKVLDPRPETEVLVLTALEQPWVRCLDLGTGSGCILLSLLAAAPCATGLGLDLSQDALAVARTNAERLDLAGRTTLMQSDWFDRADGEFDLIVSNPPYISAVEYDGLARDVREYEPKLALSPGGDGLEAYRAIARDAEEYLKPGGRLLLEIGPSQARAVCDIFALTGLLHVETRKDLDGRDRVVILQKSAV